MFAFRKDFSKARCCKCRAVLHGLQEQPMAMNLQAAEHRVSEAGHAELLVVLARGSTATNVLNAPVLERGILRSCALASSPQV